jgi:hypothetical protein
MPRNSYLCRTILGMDVPLVVLRSAAGYFIGAEDEDGSPLSRDSVEYYRAQEEATRALEEGSFTQRPHP